MAKQPTDDDPLKNVELPEIKSMWQHRNGIIYEVVCIANDASPSQSYPVMVVYKGANGNVWTRRADDWHRSMTRLA